MAISLPSVDDAYFVSRLAVEVIDPGGRSEDIWLVELACGVMSRFTFDPGERGLSGLVA